MNEMMGKQVRAIITGVGESLELDENLFRKEVPFHVAIEGTVVGWTIGEHHTVTIAGWGDVQLKYIVQVMQDVEPINE